MNDELTGDALEDAGRKAGHPRSDDGRPWSELSADEKREALDSEALDRWNDGDRDDRGDTDDTGNGERGPFAKLADDLEAGRVTPDSAVRRLFAGLAAQENGEDPGPAIYPDEEIE